MRFFMSHVVIFFCGLTAYIVCLSNVFAWKHVANNVNCIWRLQVQLQHTPRLLHLLVLSPGIGSIYRGRGVRYAQTVWSACYTSSPNVIQSFLNHAGSLFGGVSN